MGTAPPGPRYSPIWMESVEDDAYVLLGILGILPSGWEKPINNLHTDPQARLWLRSDKAFYWECGLSERSAACSSCITVGITPAGMNRGGIPIHVRARVRQVMS